MHHCPSQFPINTASTPPMTLMTIYMMAAIHRSTVKNNASPSSRLLNVVYAPTNPTVRNKQRENNIPTKVEQAQLCTASTNQLDAFPTHGAEGGITANKASRKHCLKSRSDYSVLSKRKK